MDTRLPPRATPRCCVVQDDSSPRSQSKTGGTRRRGRKTTDCFKVVESFAHDHKSNKSSITLRRSSAALRGGIAQSPRDQIGLRQDVELSEQVEGWKCKCFSASYCFILRPTIHVMTHPVQTLELNSTDNAIAREPRVQSPPPTTKTRKMSSQSRKSRPWSKCYSMLDLCVLMGVTSSLD